MNRDVVVVFAHVSGSFDRWSVDASVGRWFLCLTGHTSRVTGLSVCAVQRPVVGLVGTLSLSLSLSLSPEKENLGLERREERTGLCRPRRDQARPNHQGLKLHNSENIPTPLEL